MICFPVFLCIGAWERKSDAFSRSSIFRSCCSLRTRLSISRRCVSAVRSSVRTTLSRPSSSASSKTARKSSIFASAAASICKVSGSRSASWPQAAWISNAFSQRYLVRASCSSAVSCWASFCRKSVHFRFSSSIWRRSAEICCRLFSLPRSPSFFVSMLFCCSASSACSMSCVFWMRKRLDSSMPVKTSSNCFGSLKYSGMSSPLESSPYSSLNLASTDSRVGYFFLILRFLASSSRSRSFCSSSSSLLARRRPRGAAAFCSSKALSSASSSTCIFEVCTCICSSTHAVFLASFLSAFSWAFEFFHSCGVS
mmetsp:Transcript_99386/g.278307  ORF Transcript_99386/g.278307 Transcript_99386/m.278307 type:complete len:311 (-) Transcript_99386:409-1341(-)